MLTVLAGAVVIIGFLAFRLAGDTRETAAPATAGSNAGDSVEIRSAGTSLGRASGQEALNQAMQATGLPPWTPSQFPGPGYRLAVVDFTPPGAQGSPIVSLTFASATVTITVTQSQSGNLLPAECVPAAGVIELAAACSRSQTLGDGQKRDLYWAEFTDRSVLVLVAGREVPAAETIFAMIGSLHTN